MLVTGLGHHHLLGWANLVHNVLEVEQAVVDQLLNEATIEQAVLLQWIQVGGGSVERLEEVFLLELTEQEHLDGANLVTVSCNGHLLAVCIIDGDGLEVGCQFGKPHADEMNGGHEERL